jgi:predicted phosphodiesterase
MVAQVALEAEWKYLLNPGSCGQPRDNNPQARYGIFDTQAQEVEIFALDYDWQSAREAILAAGLPRVLGDRLAQGR